MSLNKKEVDELSKSNKIIGATVLVSVIASFSMFQSAKADEAAIETMSKKAVAQQIEMKQIEENHKGDISKIPDQYNEMEKRLKSLIKKEKELLDMTFVDGVYQTEKVQSVAYAELNESIANFFKNPENESFLDGPFVNNPRWTAEIFKNSATSVGELPVMIAYYNKNGDLTRTFELIYYTDIKKFSIERKNVTKIGSETENEDFFKNSANHHDQDQ